MPIPVENDAWLTGDTKTLASLDGHQSDATHTRAVQSYFGGLAGATSRLF